MHSSDQIHQRLQPWGSDIPLTNRAWREQADSGSKHASAERPLDVLIVTSEAPPIISGISTCVARLAGGPTARQHNVRVISSAQIRRVMFGEWRFPPSWLIGRG